MEVLYPKFPGLLAICEGCSALLHYTPKDIYGNVIYCPLCKAAIEVPFDKNYDGLIKEEKKDVLES